MRYRPTGSVLQVVLQHVTCSRRFATFTHEKPDGWGNCKYWKTVSCVGDAHGSSFIFCSQ